MELRDYLKVYWRQRWLILGLVAVATVTSCVIAATRPILYGSSQSFAINRINPEVTPDYQYDGYYALQAADLFSQTVVSWFSTPSIINAFYDRAKLDPEIGSLDSLPSRFHVKRYSAQNIVIRFTERTSTRAEAVADAMQRELKGRAEQLNQDPKGKALFEILGTDPVIAPVRPNLWLLGAVTIVVSLLLALFVVTAREYLRG